MKKQLNGALVLTGVLAASLFALSNRAFAEGETQAPESKAKVSDVAPKQAEKPAGEADVDDVITNRKLRAETGSKSKYSFSTALSYNGGTLSDPGAYTRPNISSTAFVPQKPALGGTVGGKYKISSLQSLALDFGVMIYRPFHTDPKQNFAQKSTIANPSLTYQTVYQAAGIQNVSAVSLGYATDSQYRAVGQTASVALSQTAIYDFNGSIWSVGLAGEVGYTAFNKGAGDVDGDGALLGPQQSDYYLAAYPFAEVNISDKLNLRTVFRPWIFEHNRSADFGTIARAPYTQSIGIGISITRDIYLYPNVQFAPLTYSSDRTNVGMSLNLNI